MHETPLLPPNETTQPDSGDLQGASTTTQTPGAATTAPGSIAISASSPARVPLTDADRGTLVRALICLALAGDSVAHFIHLLTLRNRSAFIESNVLHTQARAWLNGWSGGAALLIGACGLLFWLRRRDQQTLARLDAIARLLSPLMLLGFVPGLLFPWNSALELSLLLGAFVLTLEALMRLHFGAYRELPAIGRAREKIMHFILYIFPAGSFMRRRGTLLLILLCSFAYIAYTGFYTVRNHWRFNTFDYDLGQLDNLFYNALKGHPLRCTPLIRDGNWSELRNHAELSTYFLLPFYALAPRAETLLILQTTVIGLGAIPLYRFASRRLPQSTAAALAIAYLLYAPMNEANYFDFHYQPVAAGVLLWMIDMFDERRMLLFSLFYLIAIGCREDISVGLAMFGVFLVVTGTRFRAGLVIVVLSTVYFVLLRFVIMPSFGQWGFQDIYRDLFPAGDSSFRGVIATLLSNPLYTFKTLLTADKLCYILQILIPVAFLPLRRPQLLIILLPGVFFTLLTTHYAPTTEISFQYSGHFTPYLFAAAALALASYGNDAASLIRRRSAVAALIAGTLLTQVQWGSIPLRNGMHAGFAQVSPEPPSLSDRQKARDLAELAAMVPPEAALAASDRELPHVSNRLTCYTLMEGYEGADYIIYVPHTGGRDGAQAQRALGSGQYIEIASRPQLSLLKRKGAPGPVLQK